MKYLMLICMMLFVSLGYSQDAGTGSLSFMEKAGSGAFNVSKNETGKFFLDFVVYETNSGSEYVLNLKKDRSGTYNFWIGEKTVHTYKGHEVRRFKSGTYAYFTKDESTGRLIKHSLEAHENKPSGK